MADGTDDSRIERVKQLALGRWTEILRSLGVEERILQRRNGPCPLCGGTDRFQYTDRFGQGNYHCRHCGAGGGFKLLQAVLHEDFASVLRRVEACVGTGGRAPARGPAELSAEQLRRRIRRLWDAARPLQPGDPADRYLRARGLALDAPPATLRCHPALGYFEPGKDGQPRLAGTFPALLARIQRPDGQVVSLHRTYLLDGAKAPVPEPRKILCPGIQGAAVHLFEATEELAVAEGIETALAVHLATGRPVWAALGAGNLERLWLPQTVRRLDIWADNDADGGFEGQACAYALARRLVREAGKTAALDIQVMVPRAPGQDWADVWQVQARERALKAA